MAGATRYEWCDLFDWETCESQLGSSKVFNLPHRIGGNTLVGIHSYRVRACNATGCSAYTSPLLEANVACGGPASVCASSRAALAQSTVYIHTDQLGSPVAETDASGTLLQRFRYEPYGQSIEANIAQGPGYSGHVADQASGLIYMQQRYYDPIIGRFLSTDPDPVNGLGTNFNRYAYAGNNPYTFVDPDGRAFEAFLGTLAVAGADAAIIEPTDVAAPAKAAGYAGALIGTAIAGTILYAADAVMSEGANEAGGESGATEGGENGASPEINPADIGGKTPEEIDATARGAGLVPNGPDPMSGKGSYDDPVTGKQRVLVHPNDPKSGPHCHVNDCEGNRLDLEGNKTDPRSPEAHLPIDKK